VKYIIGTLQLALYTCTGQNPGIQILNQFLILRNTDKFYPKLYNAVTTNKADLKFSEIRLKYIYRLKIDLNLIFDQDFFSLASPYIYSCPS